MLGAGLMRWSTSCNVSWLWVGHTIKKKRSRKQRIALRNCCPKWMRSRKVEVQGENLV
jgi:hypothetical protein